MTGLVAIGLAAPAHAATALTSPAVSSTGAVAGSTNPNPITITFTTATSMTAGSNGVSILLPTGWSFVSPYSYTSWATSHAAVTSVTGCPGNPVNTAAQNSNGVLGSPELWVLCTSGAGTLPGPAAFTIVIPAGAVNVGSGIAFTVSTSHNPPTVIDQSVVNLNGAVSSNTVTFDANGGTGTTAAQTASSATALTANAFTRSGYTFAGWNTAANGSGTSYADAASYPFTSSVTLYAQWTVANGGGGGSTPSAADAALASTGFDAAPYLASGVLLALAGAVLLLIARRRKTI